MHGFSLYLHNCMSQQIQTFEMKEELITENAPAAIGPYSQGIIAGNMVFVSGQLPVDPQTGKIGSGTIGELTIQALNNVSAVLYAAGLTMRDVVKTTVFLTDMNDFEEMNEAYSTFFGNTAPARSAVAVKALPKNSPLEIEAIACKP